MSAPLHIETRHSGEVVILQLRGRLVAEDGAQFFREKVTSALEAGGRDVLVDLREVGYMDSGGVGALVAMFTRVGRRGGRLKLLCPTPRTCHVLEITGLLRVFEVFEDEATALQSFKTPAATIRPGQRLAG